jgi:phosphofructokinase-like protein
MERIGILTGGGDAPGLNAVIRAAVKTAQGEFDAQVLGIKQGFEGLLNAEGTLELTQREVRGILPLGGTILGTANRGNPFARRTRRNGEEIVEDASDEVVERIEALGLDALIVVGGDGTLRISMELYEKGCPVIGVPKTIDNDVGGTDACFGFDTAVETAMEAIDRLHTTAEAHHRVMVIELMGRDAGFIALSAGLAGGADVILIPEIPFKSETIYEKVRHRAKSGRYFSIISVAEGAFEEGGDQRFISDMKGGHAKRLGGIGQYVSQSVTENCEVESRVTVLGHLQRGGSPSAFDRGLATRFGAAAVRLAARKKYGRMVCLNGMEISDIQLDKALAVPKRVNLEGDEIRTARDLGICLGDS